MRKQFIFYTIAMLLMACNNQSADAKESIPATSDDNAVKKDEPIKVVASPYELTAAEIKDDSVFADGSIPVSWRNAGFSNPVAFKEFLKRFQFWVANNHKDSVADAIAFPLLGKGPKTKESFLSKYDVYFSDKVKKALGEQNFSQIFRRDKGAMIGNGQLWFNERPEGFKIIAINP